MVKTLKQSLPPTNSLVFFEASARHHSFTLASEELFVTQAAVSRQIKNLEDYLRTPLFRRLNRSIELTPAGKVLNDAVYLGLNHIAGAAQAILRRPRVRNALTISSSIGFSALRLMPRLGEIKALFADTDIKLLASDHDIYYSNDGADFIFSIDTKDPQHADYVAHAICPEEIFAVYSPLLLCDEQEDIAIDDISLYPLIDLSFEHWAHLQEEFVNWKTWYQHVGKQYDHPLPLTSLNNSLLVHQAVISGQGAALGWRHIIEDQLTSGQLRRIGDAKIAPERCLYLFVSRERADSPETALFVEWAKQELGY